MGTVALIATLASLAAFLIKRYVERQDDPERQRKQFKRKIESSIYKGDATAANLVLDDIIDGLRNKAPGAGRGQDRGAGGQGGNVPRGT